MTNVPVALGSALAAASTYLATTAETLVEALPFAGAGTGLVILIAFYLVREIRSNDRIDRHYERVEEEAREDRERAARAERLAYTYLAQLVREGITPDEYPFEERGDESGGDVESTA